MHASGRCGYGGVGDTCARVGLSRCKSLYCKGGSVCGLQYSRKFFREKFAKASKLEFLQKNFRHMVRCTEKVMIFLFRDSRFSDNRQYYL